MTSVNYNASATAALRTLQQTNAQLDTTQNRISSGFKIGEAKDNAAYWAISVTLKSDNKSLSTVKDALGLGAATVDVAYEGLNASKDVLDEIKSKLAAATQDGVDRDVIQSEIAELQKQLKSIAGSSVFSGENWLSVNSSSNDYKPEKSVVASFARDSSGSVSIGTIKVDTKNTALFDAGTTKTGILDSIGALSVDGVDLAFGGTAAAGNTSTGGLKDATGTGAGTGSAASFTYDAAWGAGDYNLGDKISFQVSLDGGKSYTKVSHTVATANLATADAFAAAVTASLDRDLGAGKLKMVNTGGALTIETLDQGTDAQFRMQGITVTDGDGIVSSRLGMTSSALTDTATGNGDTASVTFGTFDRTGLNVGDRLSFTLDRDSGGPVTINLDLTEANTLNAGAFAAALDTAAGANYNISAAGNVITIAFANAMSGGNTDQTLDVGAVSVVDGNTVTSGLGSVVVAGTADADVKGTGTKAVATGFGDFEAVTLDADDKLTFNVAIDGGAKQAVTIDKAAVNTALGGTDGKIESQADFVTVLNSVFAADSLALKARVNVDRNLEIVTTNAGAAKSVAVSDIVADKGTIAGVQGLSITDIDISGTALTARGATTDAMQTTAINAYINLVNTAINKVTTAASNLGAVSSRIDLQQEFVSKLMDSIDNGVSGLIDADMSEESTKLQALQTKQQLGVQALSIANSSAQNILRLFQ